jgi:putative peptide zinc metalloprotease protein
LTTKGFLESSLVLKKRPQASYIRYKITLIKSGFFKEKNLEYLSSFFSKERFYFLLVLLFLSNLLIFFIYKNNAISSNSSLVIAILFCSHIFHELGHAISAKCKNIDPGPVSFGFYYILPVFFIDLSDSWNIKKSDRIIINFSGILVDYLFGIFLFIGYKLTNNNIFIVSNILLFLKTFYNLNPFIRSDLYWVLVDYFEKPNLSEQSRRELMRLFSNSRESKSQPLTKSQIYMVSYSFLTTIFWTYIIINFLKQVMNGFATSRLFLNTIRKSINTGVWDVSVLISQSINLLFLFFGVFILFGITRLGIKNIVRLTK